MVIRHKWITLAGQRILDKVVSDLLDELGRSEMEFLHFAFGENAWRQGYAISMLNAMLEVKRNYGCDFGCGPTETTTITPFGEPLIPTDKFDRTAFARPEPAQSTAI